MLFQGFVLQRALWVNLDGIAYRAAAKAMVRGLAERPPAIPVDATKRWKERDGRRDPVGYRVLSASDAQWRPSNQMGVLNADLANQLEAETLGARLWRLKPGQASTRHRHQRTAEIYLLLEGIGRLRVEDALLTLDPLSAVLVEPETVRQPFNDTDREQLWFVVGAPPEPANTLEMTQEELASLYPDGPKAIPPELFREPGE